MIKCRFCKTNIYDDTIKCPHCFSLVREEERKKEKFSNNISLLSSLTTVIAIFILVWSNYQTGKSIQVQIDSLNRTDSSLILMKQQIDLMKESNQIQNDVNDLATESIEVDLKKYIESNKPIISIQKLDFKTSRDSLDLYLNIRNVGNFSSDSLIVSYVFKDSMDIDSFYYGFEKYGVIIAGNNLIVNCKIQKNNFVAKFNLKWSWVKFDYVDSLERYYFIKRNKDSLKTTYRLLSKNQVLKYWME